jgi:hypothetical protein
MLYEASKKKKKKKKKKKPDKKEKYYKVTQFIMSNKHDYSPWLFLF